MGRAARNGTGGGALSRITADTMADGAAHDGAFLYASSGLPGLLQNGCEPCGAGFCKAWVGMLTSQTIQSSVDLSQRDLHMLYVSAAICVRM